MKKLLVGSDHAGLKLKDLIRQFCIKQYKNIAVEDIGTYTPASVHYPDIAQKMATSLKQTDRGIIVCGSGIGIAIAMSKSGITCSTVFNQYMAEECGKYCQVMSLGGRIVTEEVMKVMVKLFLEKWVQ